MNDEKAIQRRDVPQGGQVIEGHEVGPDLPDPRERAAAWFRDGVGVYEVRKQAAAHIEVDPAYLHHQCKGLKPVNLVHLERMRRGNPKAFRQVVISMAMDAEMTVIPRVEVELSHGERRLLLFLKRLGLWRLVAPVIAAELYQIEVDLLDAALEQ